MSLVLHEAGSAGSCRVLTRSPTFIEQATESCPPFPNGLQCPALKGKPAASREKHKEQMFPSALCPRLTAVCPHPEPWTSHQHSWEWKEQPPTLVWERSAQLNANIAQLCERAQCLGHTAAIHERIQARPDQGILVCWATSAREQIQGVTTALGDVPAHPDGAA